MCSATDTYKIPKQIQDGKLLGTNLKGWIITVIRLLNLWPGNLLGVVVVVMSKETVQHQGITLTIEGSVNLQLSAKIVGVFEAFYNSVKYNLRCDMKRSLLAKDLTKSFEFIIHSLVCTKCQSFSTETRHQTILPFITLDWPLICMDLSGREQSIQSIGVQEGAQEPCGHTKAVPNQGGKKHAMLFLVRVMLWGADSTRATEAVSAPEGQVTTNPCGLFYTPEALQNVKESASLPRFLIRGHLDSTNCMTGELLVEVLLGR
ncbi:vacuolar protein sorting-associated protein 26C isoform X2 [Xenopus laevis]|nr:vacuolar protein sorting-associated protein 26C isoform X2 [Xenopus laevis]